MILFLVGLFLGILIGKFSIIYSNERKIAKNKFLNRKLVKGAYDNIIAEIKKGQILEIKYVSMTGEESERKIKIVNILKKKSGNDYELNSYCYLKKDERTFLISRIREAIDTETGEVILKNDN